MLQKSRSKTIAKFKYLTLLPLMLVMLTYVACSDDDSQIKDSSLDLSKFTYTVSKSGDMDANTQKQHEEYETFLLENKGYVGWGTIDLAAQEVTYSVHSKDEPVPGDFVELKVNKPGGREYIFYMNLPNNKAANSKSSVEVETTDSSARGNGDVPFAVIEEVPVFPGCESLATNQERKDCMVQNIIDVVNKNFNTALGKELGLSGVNRIYVQFKITSQGDVEVMGVRAPKPELEEEARRVVNLLPQMTPGKQDGKEVGVLYSLPITFRVGE